MCWAITFSTMLSKNCKNQLLPSLCLSVRMDQIGSHWTDFDETSYLHFFQKSVDKTQVSLKSDKNNATLHGSTSIDSS